MHLCAILTVEHQVIRRMIGVIKRLTGEGRGAGQQFLANLETILDFLCMYVDRCHHVKEEDVLFDRLEKKSVHESDRRIMEELTREHVLIMKTVGGLIEAGSSDGCGHGPAGNGMGERLGALAETYLKHMRKEEEMFFPRAERYFSHQDQSAILHEFWRFNEKSPLEKYHAALHKMEALTGMASHPSIRLFRS